MIKILLDRNVWNLIAFAVEYAVILYFFSALEPKTEGSMRAWGYVALCSIGLLYFSSHEALEKAAVYSAHNFLTQTGRMLFHGGAIFLYLLCTKEKPLSTAAYLSAFFIIGYLACQALRSVTALLAVMLGMQHMTVQLEVISAAAAECLFAVLVCRFLCLGRIRTVGMARAALAVISIFLELYFKWSLVIMKSTILRSDHWSGYIVYPCCATLGVLMMMVLFEANQHMVNERNQVRMEQLGLGYELQNAKRSLQVNTDIRRLYHDMKNHLLYIQSISGNDLKTEEYLKELLQQFDDFESQVITGNAAADALLADKIQGCRENQIRFHICMDLSPAAYVRAVDWITIFGNVVDNAVEAAKTWPVLEERIIYMKSSQFANMLVLRFSNQFSGQLKQENGRLLTSKSHAELHGIGLRSVEHAVKRYGGSMNFEFDNEKSWFRLVLMIPRQE